MLYYEKPSVFPMMMIRMMMMIMMRIMMMRMMMMMMMMMMVIMPCRYHKVLGLMARLVQRKMFVNGVRQH
jgi:hypothetical protein